MDPWPTNAHHPQVPLFPQLLQERQEGKIPAVVRGSPAHDPFAVLAPLQLQGQLEANHEDRVVGVDLNLALQLLNEGKLLLLAHLVHRGCPHLHGRHLVVVVCRLPRHLPIEALVVLYCHLRAGSYELPVPCVVLPRAEIAIGVGYHVLVLHLSVEVDADGVCGDPAGEDVLIRLEVESTRWFPGAEGRVTPHYSDILAVACTVRDSVEVHPRL
mmetsp:Transcript_41564/g.132229  ORF Transcript_41564/g.132229 Transcript_41564/m.132229 type:complete len:214 (+) Transcript_41564:2745-3386(+)